MKILILLVLVIGAISCDRKPCDENVPDQLVILSLDGFRWDYPNIYKTPNLDSIASVGVKAGRLIPVFPTKTFPNHYTMVTGLYPEHHGLVNNTYFDPVRRDTFRISDRHKVEDAYYFGGEPIWTTAGNQGLRTAALFWVGSEAPVGGRQPDTWKKFDSSLPYSDRIDTVISWLQLPRDKSPDLITWYIEEPDGVSHDYGPVSTETEAMVEYLDSLVGVFIRKVKQLERHDRINIIITSDHGMGEIHGKRYINLYDYLDSECFDYVLGYNPVILMQPKENIIDSVYNVLSAIEHIKVWKKNEIPGRLHYGKNERISDLVIEADSSWSIGIKKARDTGTGGAHGYDNKNSDMHAIFFATGPSFRSGFVADTLWNLDLYSLMCTLLNIDPAKSDGEPARIEYILVDREMN